MDILSKVQELLDIEERNDVLNLTRKERAEFEAEVIERIEEYNSVSEELKTYKDAEDNGLLLRLPCEFGASLYWIAEGYVREVWFKGIRCDKGYKPQIIARYMDGLSLKEVPITTLDNIGETVFLTKEAAEQALKQLGE